MMQVRCYNCHKPFAIGKQEAQAALEILINENLSHYDAVCPHCRRVNRISRQELEHALPGWKPTEREEPAEGQETNK